jgi:hypothetical protein
MGLDMYAYKTRAPISDYGFEEPADAVEIQYWRKHPDLHGWMERLYWRKGGTEQFNLETVRLDPADIDALEAAILNNRLPHTEGFFFGASRPEEKDLDLRFIRAAREAIQEGYAVFYTSWW